MSQAHINSLAEFVSGGFQDIDGKSRMVSFSNGYFALVTHLEPSKDAFLYSVLVKTETGDLRQALRSAPLPNDVIVRNMRAVAAKNAHPNKDVAPCVTSFPKSFAGSVPWANIRKWVVPENDASRPRGASARPLPQARV